MEYKVAKYFQIEQDIIEAIKSGRLKPGDKVDSESVLKKKYNVSTITVRKAFTDLINEGYLTGIQGLGTFVAKKQMIRGLTSLSFSDELLQQGYEIDMHVDKIELITNTQIAEKLTIDRSSRLSASAAFDWPTESPLLTKAPLLTAVCFRWKKHRQSMKRNPFTKPWLRLMSRLFGSMKIILFGKWATPQSQS